MTHWITYPIPLEHDSMCFATLFVVHAVRRTPWPLDRSMGFIFKFSSSLCRYPQVRTLKHFVRLFRSIASSALVTPSKVVRAGFSLSFSPSNESAPSQISIRYSETDSQRSPVFKGALLGCISCGKRTQRHVPIIPRRQPKLLNFDCIATPSRLASGFGTFCRYSSVNVPGSHAYNAPEPGTSSDSLHTRPWRWPLQSPPSSTPK